MRRALAIALTLAVAAPAMALDLPARKPGLWELKMEFVGRNLPMNAMKQCVDAATDKLMSANFGGSAQQACSKQDISTAGGIMTVDSTCKFGTMTTNSHAVITGDFGSAYTVDVTSSREGGTPPPGMAPSGTTHMKIAATWLGPCAAGQKPGDMIMANGMTMNILDMQKSGMIPRRP